MKLGRKKYKHKIKRLSCKIQVNLSEEEFISVDKIAERYCTTLSSIVRRYIREGIEKEEQNDQ